MEFQLKWFEKNSEHPVLAIPNFFQFFYFLHQNVSKKFRMPNFGYSKLLPVFCTKIVLKILEWQVLAKIVDSKLFLNYFVQKDWGKLEWPILAKIVHSEFF